MIEKLQTMKADIEAHGAAINQIARKLNEAKLRGHPMPYTAEDAAKIRASAIFFFEFIEVSLVLWETKQAESTREIDTALAGLAPKSRLS